MRISRSLAKALKDVPLRDADGVAVALAKAYAAEIDDMPDELRKLGPLLLATLESLGMTPRGRAAVLGKGAQDVQPPAKSPLDELRERRATRSH